MKETFHADALTWRFTLVMNWRRRKSEGTPLPPDWIVLTSRSVIGEEFPNSPEEPLRA
ncbi:hypothetical protein HNR23_004631 [Nocardiopsis mwathae]|uniref:Uncharacterized protein n=1 Tax=Nocardiopsis mwathae TaxID=1472723 RepID=A0A7W9YN38_9ACTN|nr:hypothetical protein [Nocardiopsis mwathae]